MITAIMPPAKLNRLAVEVLVRELGIVNTVRFIQQYATSEGNYSHERDEFFAGLTVNNLADEIKRRRALKAAAPSET